MAEEETVRLTDISLEPEDQRIEHGFQQEPNPPQYFQQANVPQGQLQQAYPGQYPPPGAGQVSPNHPVPGSFPQKDARMYHQQQQQQMPPQQPPNYPPGTVLYQTGTNYSPGGTSPYGQPAGAQLYPGYGTTQQMQGMTPGPQANTGSVTFVDPTMMQKAPKDYMCLSILQGMTPGPQANTGSVTFVDPTMMQKAPKDYMCLSILACLFCFCPTGCAAIYFSSQTKDSISQGNMAEAQARSKTTLKLIKISAVVFVIGTIVGLLWRFVISAYILGTSKDISRSYYDY